MTDAGDRPRADPEAPTAKLPRVSPDPGEAPTAELPRVPKAPAPRRERIRKPGPLPVIGASFGLFFAIAGLLAVQMRRGADPALGEPKPQLLAAAPPPRQILVRRVIVTRIVESAQGGAPPSPRPASVAPVTPAPPAPAPAPLTTRSS